MKKICMMFGLLLMFSFAVSAQQKDLPDNPVPKVPVTHAADKEFWWTVTAMGASDAYATAGTFYCRVNNPDVEGCTEHYGDAVGGETARALFTTAMAGIFYGCRKETNNSKWCRLIPYPVIAFNVIWGIREQTTHEQFHHDRDSLVLRRK